MEYNLYKMEFSSGVHFGNGNLEDQGFILHSDTIFSALCTEAIKMGEEVFSQLYQKTAEGALVISDAMPYVGSTYFLPKPMLYIEHQISEETDIREKDYKKLQYIPFEYFNDYLLGRMDIRAVQDILKGLGKPSMRMSARIQMQEDSVPYRTGAYFFHSKSGLYFLIGYENIADLKLLEELFIGLGCVGIGGRRSCGFGKFVLKSGKIADEILERLESQDKRYMTISTSLPKEDELDDVLQDAQYQIIKRSGFVASECYSDTPQRKRDLYVCAAGSCFSKRFSGDIYNVSSHGKHPVYRYAKPMFLGLEVKA